MFTIFTLLGLFHLIGLSLAVGSATVKLWINARLFYPISGGLQPILFSIHGFAGSYIL
jgi:hypothetical protein